MLKCIYEEEKKMKKLWKTLLVLLMVVGVTACSSKESTDEQEAVVKNFFEYVSKGETEKLSDICSKDINDDIGLKDLDDELDVYIDDAYGEVFAEEAIDFKNEVLKNFFKEYKIGDITVEDDKTFVKVTGKYLDYSTVSFDETNIQAMSEQYATEHQDELTEIYSSQGKDAVMEKIFTDIAPAMFDELKSQLAQAQEEKLDVVFTLEKNDKDKWIITEVNDNF